MMNRRDRRYRVQLRKTLKRMNTYDAEVRQATFNEFKLSGVTDAFMSRIIAANFKGKIPSVFGVRVRKFVEACIKDCDGRDTSEYELHFHPVLWRNLLSLFIQKR